MILEEWSRIWLGFVGSEVLVDSVCMVGDQCIRLQFERQVCWLLGSSEKAMTFGGIRWGVSSFQGGSYDVLTVST
jgi:hypothetical protein